MDSHLVTIEVGVKASTHQRVEADGLTLDQTGLEGLDTQTVQRRSTVEQDGVSFENILKDFPHDRFFAVDNLLGALDGLDKAALKEFADDVWFEELCGHVFGQTALMHAKLRTDDDDRTAGVVDALTEQVLTEATLLTLEGVGERLEGAVAFRLDAGNLATVVEERVDGFLQHALLVAHNDFGGLDFDQSFQTVVADDDTTVEFVDVGRSKATAVERYEGAQVRRNDRDEVHNHPLGTVVHTTGLHGTLRLTERLNDIQALEGVLFASHGGFMRGFGAQFIAEFVKVELGEELVESLGAHAGDELVGVAVGKLGVLLGQRILDVIVFLFGQQVEFLYGHLVEHSLTGLQDDVFLIVDDLVELLGGDIEQSTNLVGERAEEPDVCDGHDEFDVSHALTTDFLLGHFDAATVADNAFVADAFVLAAVALPVAGRAEDAFAEQSVAFGLVGAVVDGLRFRHLAIGATLDGLRRSKADGDGIEIGL